MVDLWESVWSFCMTMVGVWESVCSFCRTKWEFVLTMVATVFFGVIGIYLAKRWNKSPPPTSTPPEPLLPPSTTPDISPARSATVRAFPKLPIGDLDEMVGRTDELAWLKEHLIDRDTVSVAITSLTGTGGMGKTFLAQAFAQRYKADHTFLSIYLGETSPFDAGIQTLNSLGISTAEIDDAETLESAMRRFYSEGGGIVVLDDVRSEDVRVLMPQTTNWRVLITTRDQFLARKLCGQRHVKELEVLSPDETMDLYRGVLVDRFDHDLASDYQALAERLCRRPYAVRLSAGFLIEAPELTPKTLLEKLARGQRPTIDDQYSFDALENLFAQCLSQLESANPLARALLDALAVCADQGMDWDHFVEWQSDEQDADDVIKAIRHAHAFGLLLLETNRDAAEQTLYLRLHTDVLEHLRKTSLIEYGRGLSTYLKKALIDRPDGRRVDPSLQVHIYSLFSQFRHVSDFFKTFSRGWRIHLYQTGRLVWAMELNKKEEALCIELGNKDGLQRTYGNQAIILREMGQDKEADALLEKQRLIKAQIK
jgi:hypothetical protein